MGNYDLESNNMTTTFDLGGIVDTSSLGDSIPLPKKIIELCGGDIEQTCDLSTPIFNFTSNLVGLSHCAFARHRHMVLDPESVWLTIEHGLATHIKNNAEELRSKFVTFQGKVLIELSRDEFRRGSKNNWEGCFDEFSEKIKDYIGPKRDLIVGNFSSTSIVQRVSSEIVLMDAMSEYFNYGISTLCGIPQVTLTGSVEDWEIIRDKVNAFSEFGLDWWTDCLKPVLDELVNSAKGNVNKDFWKNWYNINGGSGGPFISGHINSLYPYIGIDNKQNKSILKPLSWSHNSLSSFNQSISKVPFTWNYFGTVFPMEFIGGLVGVTQNENGSIQMAFGWAVRDESVPLANYPLKYFSKDMEVYHIDGRKGYLDKAEIETFTYSNDKESVELCDVIIRWENGNKEAFTKFGFDDLLVKNPKSA